MRQHLAPLFGSFLAFAEAHADGRAADIWAWIDGMHPDAVGDDRPFLFQVFVGLCARRRALARELSSGGTTGSEPRHQQ